MGCLIELFFWTLSRFIGYFIIVPLIHIYFFLKDTALIWSVSFYLITSFLFTDTLIQEYRTIITVLLLIPVVIKLIQKIKNTYLRFKHWKLKREIRKRTYDMEINQMSTMEEDDNYYE